MSSLKRSQTTPLLPVSTESAVRIASAVIAEHGETTHARRVLAALLRWISELETENARLRAAQQADEECET